MLQSYNSKNDNLLIYINGQLYPREEAKISVFDSVVQGGDAVWEGLRLYKGKIFCLEDHLQRLQESAHILDFKDIPSNTFIIDALRQTLEANHMQDGVHIRLTLTRGEKITSGMDPRLNQKGCGLIVLAEWKAPVYPPSIKLITSSIRRNSPMFLDSKIHHNNLLNNILAKIESNYAGADAAIMLDKDGFVAEANGVNLFLIKNGQVRTPFAHACLPGITRKKVMQICQQQQIPIQQANISIGEFYAADEVFTTGTMGELTLVEEVDGRKIEKKTKKSIFRILQKHFENCTKEEGFKLF